MALGATRWQVLRKVVVPGARTGILGGFTLAMGRALGETVAVALVIGNSPVHRPLDQVAGGHAGLAHREQLRRGHRHRAGALFGAAWCCWSSGSSVNALARCWCGRRCPGRRRPRWRWPDGDHPHLRRLVRPDPPAAARDPGRGRRPRCAAARSTRRSPWACAGCFLGIAIVPLVAVVAYVVIKGLPAWNADFFTHPTDARGDPRRRGVERHRGHGRDRAHRHRGDRAPRAAVRPVPGRVGRAGSPSAVRFTADVMTGVPSITIGIFGYIAIVKNFGYSGLAGAFAIGIIMLPVIIRAGETAFRGVPGQPERGGPGPRGPEGHHRPPGGGARPPCPGSSPGYCWPWPAAWARRHRCC